MLNFISITTKFSRTKEGINICEITPKFIWKKSSDLMIRGGDFYAVWNEEEGVWSTDEETVVQIVDKELDKVAKGIEADQKHIKYMWDCDSGSIDRWHKYCQKQVRDNFHILNQNIEFSNTETKKENYSSKHLEYALEEGSIEAYDKLMSVLYSDDERHKLEWAIGSVVNGASKDVQKFLVLYGSAGTGKSTVLNIIQKLFDGYWTAFDAKSIGSGKSSFPLEPFKSFPLVGIQHDGDLSKIEDNTILNSLISHEVQPMNAKYEKLYLAKVNAFLFMGTNKPVKITDAKSGILRRLIDVSPTGNKVKSREYKQLMKQINFELGAIAWHCKEVFEEDPGYYDNYIPTTMMGASNDFYNFVVDSSAVFESTDGVTLKSSWELYKAYAEDANIPHPLTKTVFKEELKSYFKAFYDIKKMEDGLRVRNYYEQFLPEKFINSDSKSDDSESNENWIVLKKRKSLFDKNCKDYISQYATQDEKPLTSWNKCTTKLSDLDTTKVHYVRVPENHIVIDFDIKDKSGNKSLDLNLKAASIWPKTYCEVSKGGQGLHLHYIYSGDASKLSRVYDDQIEIKVFTGKSSLRRKLSLCNDIPIATISSGLPIKGDKKMIDKDIVMNEKSIITLIKRNLNKEYHPGTKPSIDFINYILENAYNSGVKYDVSSLQPSVLAFAAHSTNHAQYCMKLVANMKFKSDDYIFDEVAEDNQNPTIAIWDVEVMVNLFVCCYKLLGDNPVIKMINPTPAEIEELMTNYDLVGFNNRKYDNHIMYARGMRGYTNEQLYSLSQDMIVNKKGFFREAYNASYTDIFDFCSKKQSLKKWEIELGIHHKELGLPWDEPVPEELWDTVADYCANDVIATEAVWNARQADFSARKILVSIVKAMHGISASVNDTTNSLSQKIIFGNNRNPQSVFNYRDLSKPVSWREHSDYIDKFGSEYKFRVFDEHGIPQFRDYISGDELPDGWSILPFFPEYKFDKFAKGTKSTYLNEEIGEGGRVYSVPGMYTNVWDGDVSSMHPHSIIFEVLFGVEFTKRFEELVKARVAIKHHDFNSAGEMLNGALKPFLVEEQADSLAYALKIVINSVYGLTSAAFENPFRDINNIDNIVAKRGALFMTLLKQEVEKKGFKVAHIKTDSIKIPNATEEIKEFVIKFGKEFGYTFETEADFTKYCLINDAVYIAKTSDGKWTAVGKEFQVPYVYKKLFTKEHIEFDDLCEAFAVSKGALYLDMNENLPDCVEKEKELKRLQTKRNKVQKELYFYENETKFDVASVYKKDLDKIDKELSQLKEELEKCHNYIFVGRVGQFTPIKPGNNAGGLFRIHEGKAYAAPGSTGYRWIESENVRENENLLKEIDRSYYDNLVDEAINDISEYGDFEWFVSD